MRTGVFAIVVQLLVASSGAGFCLGYRSLRPLSVTRADLAPIAVAWTSRSLGGASQPELLTPVPALSLFRGDARDDAGIQGQRIDRSLDSIDNLVPHHVIINAATFQGRRAVHVVNQPTGGGNAIVEVSGTSTVNGTIEVDVIGQPEAGSSPGARGFIGIAFRVADDSHFECLYIRPTNGRADDQLRRNHATQYVSLPDFEFSRLRTEAPGVYESYADLVPGEWTHLRVEMAGQKARLYVNRATQPTLIVNDLKRPALPGLIGLWIGDETDGYFSRLTVRPRP
jgi:hypothetical protein